MANIPEIESEPLIVEAGGIDYIDESRRHGHPSNQFTIRFSPVIYLAPIFLGGAAITRGLGLIGSITAIVLANLLGSLAAGTCAAMGPRRGMPQMVMSRSSFGYRGNYIPAILASVLFIGYSTIGTIVGAKAMANLSGLPFVPLAIAVGLASILLAIYGYNLLHLTGRWVTGIGVVLLLIVTFFTLSYGIGPAGTPAVSGSKYWLAWLWEFTLVFSFTVSWMLYASDYSRYLPSSTKFGSVFGYAFSGLFIGSTWMMILGAFLASLKPQGVLIGLDAVLPAAVLVVALISFTITSLTHNSVNLYSCSMSSLTWDFPLKRSWTVALAGSIACILAVFLGQTDFIKHFGDFLTVMSYFMLPWLAIRLIDFFSESQSPQTNAGAFYDKDGPFKGIMWPGLIAFIVGIVVSSPFMSSGIYTGPVARMLGGADISYFISFIVAGTLYGISRSAGRKRLLANRS